jgi:putative nucleic acid binding protein
MRKPARITRHRRRTGKRLLVVVLCAVVFSCCTSQKQADPNPKVSLNSVPIQISASDLGKAYEDNVVSADFNYGGKLLSVSGPLLDITRTGDSIHVQLDASPSVRKSMSTRWVTCVFSNDRSQDLVLLKKGEQITVKGTCDARQSGSSIFLHSCFMN